MDSLNPLSVTLDSYLTRKRETGRAMIAKTKPLHTNLAGLPGGRRSLFRHLQGAVTLACATLQ
jgi:hypothetical protein